MTCTRVTNGFMNLTVQNGNNAGLHPEDRPAEFVTSALKFIVKESKTKHEKDPYTQTSFNT
jgi:hypothetical protein